MRTTKKHREYYRKSVDDGENPIVFIALLDDIDELESENARLREALAKIVNYKSDEGDSYSDLLMILTIAENAINPMELVHSTAKGKE